MKTLYLSILLLIILSFAKAATVKSTAKGGLWSDRATWENGVLPLATDQVIIVPGATVTIVGSTSCAALEVGGILVMVGAIMYSIYLFQDDSADVAVHN